ncbi:MAG: 3-deoxy-D-manno-octulosonic acid transferase [Halioglobus sp.]
MRLVYSFVLYLLLPLIVLRLLWRSRRVPGYRARIQERFGYVSPTVDAAPVVWVHAVSVGEVMAARPVIDHLLETYPLHHVLVTVSTPTGRELVGANYGDRVRFSYAPWDLPVVSRRFLSRVKPSLLVLMETELWPNWIHYCGKAGCSVLLANARLSARSASRYRNAGSLARGMFSALDAAACQSADSASRLLAAGVSKQALTITGNLKFESAVSGLVRQQAAALKREIAVANTGSSSISEPFIVIACSTHPAEEEQVLRGFARLRLSVAHSVLILVPRHPERAQRVAVLCADYGFEVALRSRAELPGPDGGVLLCDIMGELPMLCGAAMAAFIGGSLVPLGGQNPLDAANWQLPILIGEHVFNFEKMVGDLEHAGALAIVTDGEDLGRWWQKLASDEALRRRMGTAGMEVVLSNRGAMEKLAPVLEDLLQGG